MSQPSIGTGAGDFAALLEVARRPDARALRRDTRPDTPTASVLQVGVASQQHDHADAKPSGTRRRASRRVRIEAPFTSVPICRCHGVDHLATRRLGPDTTAVPCSVADANSGSAASATRDVSERPRTVAARVGRAEYPDERRAERGRQVQRPGVTRDDDPRRGQHGDEIGQRRRRRGRSRTVRGRATSAADNASSPGPHSTIARSRRARVDRGRSGAEPLGRPTFVRPCGARVEHERSRRRDRARASGASCRARPTPACAAETSAPETGRPPTASTSVSPRWTTCVRAPGSHDLGVARGSPSLADVSAARSRRCAPRRTGARAPPT